MAKTNDSQAIARIDSIAQVDKMDLDEYGNWLASEGITVEDFDGGSDWDLVGNKDSLVGVPFVIARIRFNDSESGRFVSVCAYTKDNEKVVFNDGGTGVMNQLENYVVKHNRSTAINCPKGLRVSRYKYTDEKGVERDAATYYIA